MHIGCGERVATELEFRMHGSMEWDGAWDEAWDGYGSMEALEH